MEHPAIESIVILDFGSQYTQLIARRVREQNVFSAVLPCTASLSEIQEYNPVGIILSGGPCSVYDADAPPADERVLALGVPVLGICYGLQFITHKLGGKVSAGVKREYGHAEVCLIDNSPLFARSAVGNERMDVARRRSAGAAGRAFNWSASRPPRWPPSKTARGASSPCSSTPRFTTPATARRSCATSSLASAAPSRTGRRSVLSNRRLRNVRQTVGPSGRAICAISGGVDSSVAATLVSRALGERLTCVFVNNGVLRKNEFEKVQQSLRTGLGLNIDAVDASDRFLTKLAGLPIPSASAKLSATNSSRSSSAKRAASSRFRVTSSGWCRERFTRM